MFISGPLLVDTYWVLWDMKDMFGGGLKLSVKGSIRYNTMFGTSEKVPSEMCALVKCNLLLNCVDSMSFGQIFDHLVKHELFFHAIRK
jgi:hypothetical protein